MSINTAHTNNGVLLHAGESILLFCDNVTMHFSGGGNVAALKSGGDKSGRLYLTTHRMIFNNKKEDLLKSFSFPFVALRNVELEQPIFGANYIKGNVLAQPDGGFQGEVKFKLYFKSGGAIDFGTAMLKAAQMASRNYNQNAPPPYTAPSGPWYAAPPPAYTAHPGGYMGWVPPTNVFTEQPPPNSVFMTDAPPPYPGINGNASPYPTQAPPNASTYGAWSAPQGAGAMPPSTAPSMNGATSSADAKAAEATASGTVQTGYYDPSNPQTAYIPPGTGELPPSYDDATKKNN